MYEIFEQLLQQHGLSAYKLSKKTGISQSTLSDWKNGKSVPKQDKLKIIADYFNVSIDYLMTGKGEDKQQLTEKDKKDIAKDLQKIMNDIKDAKDSPIYYNGEEIDEMSLELMENALESALKQLKIINKEKYNPNKNKSR